MYRRTTVIAIWSFLLAGAAYLFLFEPGKSGFFLPCIFRLLTGFTCPGCGSTRAMHQVLHGHFLAAFELNPLLLLAIPFLLFALLRYSVIVMRGGVPRHNVLPARRSAPSLPSPRGGPSPVRHKLRCFVLGRVPNHVSLLFRVPFIPNR